MVKYATALRLMAGADREDQEIAMLALHLLQSALVRARTPGPELDGRELTLAASGRRRRPGICIRAATDGRQGHHGSAGRSRRLARGSRTSRRGGISPTCTAMRDRTLACDRALRWPFYSTRQKGKRLGSGTAAIKLQYGS